MQILLVSNMYYYSFLKKIDVACVPVSQSGYHTKKIHSN
jgi:hypothetical protein